MFKVGDIVIPKPGKIRDTYDKSVNLSQIKEAEVLSYNSREDSIHLRAVRGYFLYNGHKNNTIYVSKDSFILKSDSLKLREYAIF